MFETRDGAAVLLGGDCLLFEAAGRDESADAPVQGVTIIASSLFIMHGNSSSEKCVVFKVKIILSIGYI